MANNISAETRTTAALLKTVRFRLQVEVRHIDSKLQQAAEILPPALEQSRFFCDIFTLRPRCLNLWGIFKRNY